MEVATPDGEAHMGDPVLNGKPRWETQSWMRTLYAEWEAIPEWDAHMLNGNSIPQVVATAAQPL